MFLWNLFSDLDHIRAPSKCSQFSDIQEKSINAFTQRKEKQKEQYLMNTCPGQTLYRHHSFYLHNDPARKALQLNLWVTYMRLRKVKWLA